MGDGVLWCSGVGNVVVGAGGVGVNVVMMEVPCSPPLTLDFCFVAGIFVFFLVVLLLLYHLELHALLCGQAT